MSVLINFRLSRKCTMLWLWHLFVWIKSLMCVTVQIFNSLQCFQIFYAFSTSQRWHCFQAAAFVRLGRSYHHNILWTARAIPIDDDVIRFWRSKVTVTAGRQGGKAIHVDTRTSQSILYLNLASFLAFYLDTSRFTSSLVLEDTLWV